MSKSSKVTKELFCAPDINSDGITCYSKEDLIFLIKAYNKKKSKNHHIKIGDKSKKGYG